MKRKKKDKKKCMNVYAKWESVLKGLVSCMKTRNSRIPIYFWTEAEWNETRQVIN